MKEGTRAGARSPAIPHSSYSGGVPIVHCVNGITPPSPSCGALDRHLLEAMVSLGASDLHLTVGSAPAIRVRGELARLEGLPALTPETTQELLYRVLSTGQQKQLEIKRQIDTSYAIPGLARFRVNVYFQREALAAAFRVIPEELKTLEELNLPASLAELAMLPRGLVLVTGPTGSGKSTTLAAMIDEVNRNRTDHILTIEDPIEFVHRHKRCIVNQREIGVDTTSFGEALRAALRQDPDVILVGEMRDLETIATGTHGRRDGPPRVRHAPHAERPGHGRPDHRRLSRRAAGAGPDHARRLAAGDRHSGAAADR